jgi:signal transduction histidine kinase
MSLREDERKMNTASDAKRSSVFRRRLTLALITLATIAALQGGFAIWAVGLAEHHVLRGRVAADIQQNFTLLRFSKQNLRNWLAQRQFGAHASDEQRDTLILNIQNTLDKLDSLAEQATLLDQDSISRRRQAQRREALLVLRVSLNQMAHSLANLVQPSSGLDTTSAWRAANELFDNAEGRDLRLLLADSLAREEASLREKRADTDDTLAWLRQLWIGTTTFLVLTALVLTVSFARTLRRPLLALTEGAAALRDGQLSHRILLRGSDEFSEVARSMNSMAEELSAHRARELQARQALEEQVADRTKELTIALNAQKDAEARRRQLFADISHELRTPTTAIRGEAQIALRGEEKSSEEYRDSLRRIDDATQQLGKIIDDLLTMARSDIDTLSLHRSLIDITDVLNDVLSFGRAMAKTYNVQITSEPWPTKFMIRGDSDRLTQMFLVLIDNAVRYSYPGATVRLTARRVETEDSTVEVVISDTGIGIEPAELSKVFDRGHRAQNAKAHRNDGSGLGLSIARALAHAHHGEIELRNNQPSGTLAVVILPLINIKTGVS